MVSRRLFTTYGMFLLGTTALVGCATTPSTPGTTPPAAVTVAVNDIENYIQSFLNGVTALSSSSMIIKLLTPDQLSNISSDVASAQVVLAQVKASAETVLLATAQNWATEIETDVNAVTKILGVIPGLPGTAVTIIDAINALLPVFLSSVQVAITNKGAYGGASTMSPDQARAILAKPPQV